MPVLSRDRSDERPVPDALNNLSAAAGSDMSPSADDDFDDFDPCDFNAPERSYNVPENEPAPRHSAR